MILSLKEKDLDKFRKQSMNLSRSLVPSYPNLKGFQ